MSTFIFSFLVLLALLCNTLIMYVLAWLLTEKIKLRITVKPFSCRECLSFWLTLLGGIVIAFAILKRGPVFPTVQAQQFARLIVVYAAAFLGFVNYLYIKSKFKIYE